MEHKTLGVIKRIYEEYSWRLIGYLQEGYDMAAAITWLVGDPGLLSSLLAKVEHAPPKGKGKGKDGKEGKDGKNAKEGRQTNKDSSDPSQRAWSSSGGWGSRSWSSWNDSGNGGWKSSDAAGGDDWAASNWTKPRRGTKRRAGNGWGKRGGAY